MRRKCLFSRVPLFPIDLLLFFNTASLPLCVHLSKMSKRPLEPPMVPSEREELVSILQEHWHDHPPERLSELNGDNGRLLRLEPGQLYRAPSTLAPNAGLGLFSALALPRGTLITWYDGAVVSMPEYMALKKEDAEYYSYAVSLNRRSLVLGNYRRDDAGGALHKIPYEQLETYFRHRGAFQFMNGGPFINSPEVNVDGITIEERRRQVPADTPPDRLLDETERREALYPDSVMRVAVALVDIPAATELVMVYGPHQMVLVRGKRPGGKSMFRACIVCDWPVPADSPHVIGETAYCPKHYDLEWH